jgi:hypothetical protein
MLGRPPCYAHLHAYLCLYVLLLLLYAHGERSPSDTPPDTRCLACPTCRRTPYTLALM